VRASGPRVEEWVRARMTCISADGARKAKVYADPVASMPRFTWHPWKGNRFDNPVHKRFFEECIRRGLFLAPWRAAFVNYSHADADLDEALKICDDAMAATLKNYQPQNAKSSA